MENYCLHKLIMAQVKIFTRERVTDITAIANDYVKVVFRTYNEAMGNKTTGWLFKMSVIGLRFCIRGN